MELKPGIRKRGSSYQFVVSLGFDGNGKQIRQYKSYTPPEGLSPSKLKKDIEAAYDEFQSKVSNNPNLKESMIFSDLGEMYFEKYAPNRLKKVTAYTYQSTYRTNIKPYFGNMKLKNISTSTVTDFLSTLSESHMPQSVRKNKIILHSILNFAVSQGFITKNPCIGSIWNHDTENIEAKKENYLTAEQAKALLNIVSPYSTFNTIIKVLLFTGLRSGEVLGLTWDKIDFEEKTLLIDKTLSYVTGEYYLSTPKTAGSLRKIKIDDYLVDLLRQHREEQNKLKEIVGDGWLQPDAVFTSATGHYYDRCLLNTQLRRLLKNHPEVGKVTIHGLRHTYASLLIVAGENLDAISKVLGHASADITSRVYAHTMAEVQVRITKTISTVLREAE